MIHIRQIFPSHATRRQLPQDTQTELDMRQRRLISHLVPLSVFYSTIKYIQYSLIYSINQS